MSKRDISLTVIVGLLSGIIWPLIIKQIVDLSFLGNGVWWLIVILPILFLAVLYIGHLLSSWKSFFSKFAKFGITGVFNTGIDLGVFNLLIFISGIAQGRAITIFKGTSFIAALINSYFWNKFWTFEAGGTGKAGAEFARYVAVTVIGFLLNVSVAYYIANVLTPFAGINIITWDNIAAGVASIVNLLWNFIGYNILVFKKNK